MSHRVLGEQLAMFYTPPQIKERWGILPGDRKSLQDDEMSDDEVWDAKREENDSYMPGFESDVRNEGVIAPVTLGKEYIQDGHHRIAAARDDQLIPAQHTSDPKEIGMSSPAIFDAQSMYRYPSMHEGFPGDDHYDPENPQHKLVGGSTFAWAQSVGKRDVDGAYVRRQKRVSP